MTRKRQFEKKKETHNKRVHSVYVLFFLTIECPQGVHAIVMATRKIARYSLGCRR
ncbi:hypothetical protein ROSEINA2194_02738 [Roseburia inulinivorans DSM 16841]|uniref:Uncharacterized protein n=1 Tax=Roseburia inulinivorans DSM 16841 TaxID=622312 RepID=C0FVG4_9FIRM|nr:hypothetical protein ROSEINA2194_02738 [Roseburia inulinivorans DSM 16841]